LSAASSPSRTSTESSAASIDVRLAISHATLRVAVGRGFQLPAYANLRHRQLVLVADGLRRRGQAGEGAAEADRAQHHSIFSTRSC